MQHGVGNAVLDKAWSRYSAFKQFTGFVLYMNHVSSTRPQNF